MESEGEGREGQGAVKERESESGSEMVRQAKRDGVCGDSEWKVW